MQDQNPKEKEFSINIPVSIFRNRTLSSLEVVVVYLKDELQYSYHEIALMLNRDDRTIWTCYNRAGKKRGHDKN
jgi:hypothetical protein